MDPEIKKLYDQANGLYVQAKGILAEFDGKDMPNEKAEEVNRLLDKVDELTQQAKALEEKAAGDARRKERMESGRQLFEQPASDSRKSFFQGQPITPARNVSPEYEKAFQHYLRYGEQGLTPDAVKALVERKLLAAGEATAGGYLVRDTFINELLQKAREAQAMRRICRVLPRVPSGSVITPTVDTDLTDATWTTEILTGSEDTVKPFGGRKLTPHPLAKRIKVSNTLLRIPDFDVEGFVNEQFAYKFAVPMENGYINGNGAQQPLGLLNTAGLPTYTTAVALTVGADDIIQWVYRLPASYSAGATILCNRAFVRKLRLLKTADNYLWQPGLQVGSPSKILDYPYEYSDRYDDGLSGADAWEANALIAVIGNFKFYWIVDAIDFSIQRLVELYAESNETGYIGRWESDGMAMLAEAFYALKVHP